MSYCESLRVYTFYECFKCEMKVVRIVEDRNNTIIFCNSDILITLMVAQQYHLYNYYFFKYEIYFTVSLIIDTQVLLSIFMLKLDIKSLVSIIFETTYL